MKMKMKMTNLMTFVVLLGGSVAMVAQCLPSGGPDLAAVKRYDAELSVRQQQLIRRYADEAAARGDAALAAFYRDMEVSCARE